MEKNKLYLFPYGQDKCHTAYSFQIMYIFTQLLHYQDHLLFSPLSSLTLENPKSPSGALAVLASPRPYLPQADSHCICMSYTSLEICMQWLPAGSWSSAKEFSWVSLTIIAPL